MALVTDSRISKTSGSRSEVRIPMLDGIELSANLYLPDPAMGPQPCIIEALPYRKDDLTSSYEPEYLRLRDEFDYAVCRIDLRGTGSSGGRATDEYPAEEQRDLAVAMEWLARQDWCSGAIGMYGTSYSGFNSLQMACERPPELKAIVAIYATDDRYTDDVHYRGGALKFLDLVDYCNYMTSMNALPPVPALWGDGWREEWVRRIEEHEPWTLNWLREQRNGPYWRHGSVRPDYDRIQCPTMVIAGWADGYRNASYRLIERLRANEVPHRLLAGPWSHASTHNSRPGPRIDSVPEMAAWWDRWLRGVENDVDDGLSTPAMTLFVRTSTRPEPDLDNSEGFWIREEWPCPRVADETVLLEAREPYVVDPSVGTSAWIDCAGALPWGQSADQRHDDASSITWDLDAAGRVLMGQPTVRLRISVDQPVAMLSLKLCDVFPDGTSALVTRGSLNLTHREGHDKPPVALTPGQVYDVEVELDACAYRFDPGQQLRLSLAGADWPNTAAPPSPLSLVVHAAELQLPCWRGVSPHTRPKLIAGRSKDAAEESAHDGTLWQLERDVLTREVRCRVDHGGDSETPYDSHTKEHYVGTVAVNTRTFRQTADATSSYEISWPTATVTSRATLSMVADETQYDVTIILEALEDARLVRRREWHEQIPRDLA